MPRACSRSLEVSLIGAAVGRTTLGRAEHTVHVSEGLARNPGRWCVGALTLALFDAMFLLTGWETLPTACWWQKTRQAGRWVAQPQLDVANAANKPLLSARHAQNLAHCQNGHYCSLQFQFSDGGSRAASRLLQFELKNPIKDHVGAVQGMLEFLSNNLSRTFASEVSAVGHRVVHGLDTSEPALLTDAMIEKLKQAATLAPLHNPPGISGVLAAKQVFSSVPHVGVSWINVALRKVLAIIN